MWRQKHHQCRLPTRQKKKKNIRVVVNLFFINPETKKAQLDF
jgi:hypothetical protein